MPIRYENKDWDFADLVKHIKKTKPNIASPGGYVKEIEEKQKGSSLSGIILNAKLSFTRQKMASLDSEFATKQMVQKWWNSLNVSKRQHAIDPNRKFDLMSFTVAKRKFEDFDNDELQKLIYPSYSFRHQDMDMKKIIGFTPDDPKKWWDLCNISQRWHMIDPHEIYPETINLVSRNYDDLSDEQKKIVLKMFNDRHSEQAKNPEKSAKMAVTDMLPQFQCFQCKKSFDNYKMLMEHYEKSQHVKTAVQSDQPQFKCDNCGYQGDSFTGLMQHYYEKGHGQKFVNNKTASNMKLGSLVSQTEDGQYAVYFLLQGDEVNGRGWGVTAESIPQNIHTFNKMPFVVTSNEVFKDSPYGRSYDHPSTEHLTYLGLMPAGSYDVNDLDLIHAFQNRFRIGMLFDPFFKDGTWRVMVKKDEKFKDVPWPPFVSPAIYKLDSSESDGTIKKWVGLHLAGLDTRPAYGTVAILHGSCSGPYGHCEHQLKTASMGTITPCSVNALITSLKKHRQMQSALNSGDMRNVQILNLGKKKKKSGRLDENIVGFGNEKFQTELRNMI